MITAMDVSYRYGDRRALDGATLSFPPNRVSGLLGMNGAGKSTLLKILTGIIAPENGRVEMDGVDIHRDRRPLAGVGYLPETPPVHPDLTVAEQLTHAAALKNLARIRSHVDRAMEAMDIGSVSRRLIGNLSKGFRQRVGIAQALLGDPVAIILDEPTSGLDPGQLHAFRGMVRGLARERTVIFSSHTLSEVRAVCDDVSILAKGRVVATGAMGDVARRVAATGLLLTLDRARDAIAPDAFALEGIERIEFADNATEPGTTTLRLICPDTLAMRRRVSELAVARGLTVLELRALDTGLEDVFAAYAAAE